MMPTPSLTPEHSPSAQTNPPAGPDNTQPLLIRALSGQHAIERPPVWLMRQAGRYMHEYQAVRAKADFMTLCKTPELAVEVSMQPIKAFDMDASIVFSDILPPAEAMGLKLIFNDAGPCFPEPLKPDGLSQLRIPDPKADLGFMLETLKLLRAELPREKALLGFAGAPWTLATYMIEGQTSRHLHQIKSWLYNAPRTLTQLLAMLSETVARYLIAQIEAGAQALQLFDTWAGQLHPETYQQFVLPYQQQVIAAVKAAHPGVPVILYARGSRGLLPLLARSGATVLSLDEHTDLGATHQWLVENQMSHVALQGNLDPVMLWQASAQTVAQAARQIAQTGMALNAGKGYGFNLGHGILPKTPRENVQRVIEAIKSM
ncbi:MAG: uroporphyrinogen decarboxylase [Vampirovibrionales bacterium]|nr:uroporphyrinogen decarboxylase [Vampirovibrionales bacterium]